MAWKCCNQEAAGYLGKLVLPRVLWSNLHYLCHPLNRTSASFTALCSRHPFPWRYFSTASLCFRRKDWHPLLYLRRIIAGKLRCSSSYTDEVVDGNALILTSPPTTTPFTSRSTLASTQASWQQVTLAWLPLFQLPSYLRLSWIFLMLDCLSDQTSDTLLLKVQSLPKLAVFLFMLQMSFYLALARSSDCSTSTWSCCHSCRSLLFAMP